MGFYYCYPPMSINDLPNSCLRNILAFLPVQDLIQIGLVCRKWHALQWSVFCRQKSVSILVGRNALDLISESRFVIPHLDKIVDEQGKQLYPPQHGSIFIQLKTLSLNWKMVHFLADSFPNIIDLEMVLKEVSSSAIDHVIYLLHFWIARLQTVKIYCRFSSEVRRSTVSDRLYRLLDILNSLPSIRLLTLVFDTRFVFVEPNVSYQIYLPVLSRLEEFYFATVDEPQCLLNSLERFAIKNRKLRKIGIASYIDANNVHSHERFLSINHRLVSRFRQLFIMKPPVDSEYLFKFCSVYTSLTSIKIFNIALTLSQLAATLVPLHSLVHLGFAIKFFRKAPFFKDDLVPANKIPQLPSIKVLTLNVSLKSHTDLHSRHLGHIFSGLQVLQINHDFFHCITCKCDHYRKTSKVKCKECMVELLSPWKQQCLQLKFIYTESYRKMIEWNMNDL